MIERIDAREFHPRQFALRYGIPSRPVILRSLFAGQPIESIFTLDEAVRRWGALTLSRVDQQSTQLRRAVLALFEGRPLPRGLSDGEVESEETIAAFLAGGQAGDEPARPHQLHGATPAAVRALYQVPALCDRRLYPWCHDPDEPSTVPPARHQLLFLGRRGHFADLHCHADLHHILLHQIFGRKRVVLFPPEATGKLAPLMHLSTVALERMTPAEQRDFVAYAGGQVDELAPGETLFLPAAWWHHLDYLEDAMAMNLRFAEPDDPDLQALLRTSTDCRGTRVALAFRDPAVLARRRPDLLRLRALATAAGRSSRERRQDLDAAVLSLHRELFPDDSRASIDWNDVPFSALRARPPRSGDAAPATSPG